MTNPWLSLRRSLGRDPDMRHGWPYLVGAGLWLLGLADGYPTPLLPHLSETEPRWYVPFAMVLFILGAADLAPTRWRRGAILLRSMAVVLAAGSLAAMACAR